MSSTHRLAISLVLASTSNAVHNYWGQGIMLSADKNRNYTFILAAHKEALINVVVIIWNHNQQVLKAIIFVYGVFLSRTQKAAGIRSIYQAVGAQDEIKI